MVLHRYFIKTPWIVKKWFSSYVWNMPRNEKTIYLTFDDGPHPEITAFVLDELKQYNAKASFFCLGNNVALYPQIYERMINEGHAVGNHTYNHPNGWEISTEEYLNDIIKASKYIQSNLFRPPYGRIKKEQAKKVKEAMKNENVKIIMWDVLSADFDTEFSPQQCLDNVLKNCRNGSIVVFHDSEKAFPNLRYCFPEAIKQLAKEGYRFKKIEL
jgi:peptidoglycan/xylan/chitin deacetylase (PgdA/CDA1 family)